MDWDPDLDCDDCGGPGPPPEFLIPPPPRPPFMHELITCTEDSVMPDVEMCEAIPTIDASYVSGPSFQTSAIVLLITVLLVFIILITSLFLWKHKRKVQNFLPCKTPTRGPLDGTTVSPHGLGVTYEDPDAHLGHRPLVMRHHHPNMEMLHPKALHYPSGFPMPRSPPLFICSSPGPDPYRSHDNVYEELEHRPDSDSERAHHSDDEFAEDELSLPGERSFQKSSPDGTTVATIYQERSTGSSSNGAGSSNEVPVEPYTIERNRTERNSLLSSSSSGTNNDNQSRAVRNSNSSSDCGVNNSNNSGLFRCSRNSNNNLSNKNSSISRQKLPNTFGNGGAHVESDPTSPVILAGSDIPPAIYDDRSLMSLPPSYSSGSVNNNANVHSNNNSTIVNTVNNVNNNHANNFYGPVDDRELSEVERRNRINSQLSNHPVATIFRGDRPRALHHHHMNSSNRSRTNPRSLDRRRFATPPIGDPNYLYQEPVYHHDGSMLYDGCLSHATYSTPYQIIPEFSTFRHPSQMAASATINPNGQPMAVYSRDSSFGSDSGYSHNTQNSNRSNNTNNVMMPNSAQQGPPQQQQQTNSWWNRSRSKGRGNNRGTTLSSLNRDS
ncbi:putative uncharacterized protein DDB_G0286901 [Culicoides brevitarsis]|uniref:putative uncharacterized protein DDB_G0286901 n=1 Tax=Culicoides brevitarsis TaxID=469753 RepID=UPI00307C5836